MVKYKDMIYYLDTQKSNTEWEDNGRAVHELYENVTRKGPEVA